MTMSDNALLSARKGLAQAQAFQSGLDEDVPMSGEDRQTLRRMTDHVLDNADLHRRNSATSAAEHRNAATEDATAELQAANRRLLPESLQDEPTKSERFRQAVKDRKWGTSITLDVARTRRFMKLAAEGNREELTLVVGTNNKGGFWVPDEYEQRTNDAYLAVEGVTELVEPLFVDNDRDIHFTDTGPAILTAGQDPSLYFVAEQGAYRQDIDRTLHGGAMVGEKLMQKVRVSEELAELSAVDPFAVAVGNAASFFAQVLEGMATILPAAYSVRRGVFSAPTNHTDTATSGTTVFSDVAKLLAHRSYSGPGTAFLAGRAAWASIVDETAGANWAAASVNDEGRVLLWGIPLHYASMYAGRAQTAGGFPVGLGTWPAHVATRMSNIRMTITGMEHSDIDDYQVRFRQILGNLLMDDQAALFLRVKA